MNKKPTKKRKVEKSLASVLDRIDHDMAKLRRVKPVKAKPVKAKPVKAKPVKAKPVKAKPVKVRVARVVKVKVPKVPVVTPENIADLHLRCDVLTQRMNGMKAGIETTVERVLARRLAKGSEDKTPPSFSDQLAMALVGPRRADAQIHESTTRVLGKLTDDVEGLVGRVTAVERDLADLKGTWDLAKGLADTLKRIREKAAGCEVCGCGCATPEPTPADVLKGESDTTHTGIPGLEKAEWVVVPPGLTSWALKLPDGTVLGRVGVRGVSEEVADDDPAKCWFECFSKDENHSDVGYTTDLKEARAAVVGILRRVASQRAPTPEDF